MSKAHYSRTNKSYLFNRFYLKDSSVLLILFSLTVIFFHNVIFSWNNQVLSDPGTDLRHQLFYWRYFGFESIKNGEIPLWNPYIYSGMPFVAGMQSAIFYPLNWIYLILPIDIAINYSIILHVYLSGVFTFYLSKTLGVNRFGAMVSAIIFMFCAPQIFHIYPGHLPNLCTMIWLPLVLLMLELAIKKVKVIYALLGGTAIAFQILAGHPQYLFYSSIAVSLYFVIRVGIEINEKRDCENGLFCLALFLIMFGSGVFLAAVQLIPGIEMIKYSTRQDIDFDWVSVFSFPPENFITWLVPEFFGNLLDMPYWGRCYLWEMSAYIGIFSVIFAGIAVSFKKNKYSVVFISISFISLFLALGRYTPLLHLLYNYAPGFDKFRGNSKFIFVVAFSMAMLAGFGCGIIANEENLKTKRFKRFYFVFSVISGIVIILCVSFIYFYKSGILSWTALMAKSYSCGERYIPSPPSLSDSQFVNEAFNAASNSIIIFVVNLAICFAVITLRVKKILNCNIIKLLVTAIIFIDLWLYGAKYMKTFDVTDCLWDQDMVEFLNSESEQPFRAISSIGSSAVNQGMAHKVGNIGGYDANLIKTYNEFMNVSEGVQIEQFKSTFRGISKLTKLTNLLNVKYLIMDTDYTMNNPMLKSVFNNGHFRIYENLSCLPRTFIVEEAKVITEKERIFNELRSDSFDPLQYAILEEEPVPLETPVDTDNVEKSYSKIIEYSLNKVVIDAALVNQGILVLSDVYYPGWNVYVDGKKDRIYKTDYTLRGALLNPGHHRVEFKFEPSSFKLGILITLLSILFITIFITYSYVSNTRKVEKL